MQASRTANTRRMTATVIAMVASAASFAEPSFFDYARVLEVDPITETVGVPLREERCERSRRALRADEAFAGDVRSTSPELSIGAAVSEEIRHREHTAASRRCRLVTVYEERVRVVGYHVRYTYGGGPRRSKDGV